MNLATWLVRTARLCPDRPALMRGTASLADYRAFARSAAALGRALGHRYKIAPGDRVAIFAANTPDYLIALYGIWFAGAAAVPINAKLHAREAAWIVEDSGARLAFVTEKPGAALAPLLPASCGTVIELGSPDFQADCGGDGLAEPVARQRDDLAWLFYTSGTTGRPKGVMISNGNIHAMVFAYVVDVDAVNARDAALYAAPMSHGAGLYNVQHVLKGARHVVPESGGFDPAEILESAALLRDVHMFAAPTMVRRLVDAARTAGTNGDGIRTVIYGGGPMYLADIIDAVDVMGPRFCQIYGQGESPMTITALGRDLVADRAHPRWRERLASVGTAQSCVDVRTLDGEGRPVPVGEAGEVAVRGASVMSGYWNNPAATVDTLRDGWLRTGDIGAFDADGFLTLKDRSKDVIISGGANIYPREVEEVLLTHPAIREVSVVGQRDAQWGEAVIAFVVAAPDAAIGAGELDRYCLDRIARFKRPKTYRFVAELPKNNYGKVLKTELRAILAENPEGEEV